MITVGLTLVIFLIWMDDFFLMREGLKSWFSAHGFVKL
ncbi:hypothetical protein EDC32_10353 [Laceyella sacchari]|jgi:hypothetical protein|nr:hypothetical protein EDC32_10353 [Laceyella sacchari]